MITSQQRDALFSRRVEELDDPVEMFARIVKDYERTWLDFIIPAGTIVPVEIYTFPPDIMIIRNKRYTVYASESDFFELL